MALNIVDLVKDQLGEQLVGQLGGVLGTDSQQTNSALGSAVPGMLNGLLTSSGNTNGANALFDSVSKFDDGMLDNLGGMLQEQSSSVINQGNGLLGSILGTGALGTLGSVLGSVTGLGGSKSSSLLGMLAPIVIGIIKRKFLSGNMNAAGLASMLGEQKQNINSAMPQGLSEQFMSSGFYDSIAQAQSSDSQNTSYAGQGNTSEPTKKSGGLPKWLLPLVGLLVLAWLAMKFFGGSGDEQTSESATQATTEAASNTALPDGVNLDEISTNLTGVFDSTTSALGEVSDAASAENALPALEEAASNLGDISGLLDKVPEAARGPLNSVISGGLETLQPIIEQVLALPGVGSILEPVIAPMLETLQGMAG